VTPRRWPSAVRPWVYLLLCQRDGESCALCGIVPTAQKNHSSFVPTAQKNHSSFVPTAQNTLDIDHVDGNSRNDDPANLRLLCRSCNTALENRARKARARRRPSDLREREKKKEGAGESGSERERERGEGQAATRVVREAVDYRDGSSEMQANQRFEVPFRTWVLQQVATNGHIEKAAAIAAGAEHVGCSTVASRRYLDKLTSSVGPLQQTEDAQGRRVLVLKEHLH